MTISSFNTTRYYATFQPRQITSNQTTLNFESHADKCEVIAHKQAEVRNGGKTLNRLLAVLGVSTASFVNWGVLPAHFRPTQATAFRASEILQKALSCPKEGGLLLNIEKKDAILLNIANSVTESCPDFKQRFANKLTIEGQIILGPYANTFNTKPSSSLSNPYQQKLTHGEYKPWGFYPPAFVPPIASAIEITDTKGNTRVVIPKGATP
jgi:hypothetical protein